MIDIVCTQFAYIVREYLFELLYRVSHTMLCPYLTELCGLSVDIHRPFMRTCLHTSTSLTRSLRAYRIQVVTFIHMINVRYKKV